MVPTSASAVALRFYIAMLNRDFTSELTFPNRFDLVKYLVISGFSDATHTEYFTTYIVLSAWASGPI